MKMSFGRRLVLFLHWLLSLLLFAYTLICMVAPQLIDELASLINGLLGARLASVAGIVALAIYVIFAVAAVIVLFARPDKRAERGFITVDDSETGRTRIAVGAVDQMIRQAVRGVDGIAEMKSAITNNADDISIDCSVTIVNGAHVPTVTMNIQRAIRSYIELNCGVAVRGVSVSVNSLDTGEGKGRKKAVKGGAAVVPAAAAAYVPEPASAEPEAHKEAVPEAAAEAAVPAEEAAVEEAAAEAAEAAAEELPELEPIVLTLDPAVQEDAEAPAEEAQAEE